VLTLRIVLIVLLVVAVVYFEFKLRRQREPAWWFEIVQLGEYSMPTNNSIVAGTTGVFVAVPEPAGTAIPAGAPAPTWSASDPSVVITNNSSDPSGLTVDVAVPAGDTETVFTLSVSGPDGASGAIISGSVSVTITQPVPPPAPAPTSFAVTQLS
jgi:hypothetical protein